MKFRKNLVLAAGLALAGVFSTGAQAAASADFTAAQTALLTDIATYGGGLVAVSVVGVGFGVAIKYIKKLRGAA